MMFLIVSTGLALSLSQFLDVIFLSRNKLMQRRIQETDRNRVALQSLVQTFEVALLIRKDLIQSCFSLFYGVSSRSSHGMQRFCLPRRTYAQYGKDRYLLRQALVAFFASAGVSALVRTFSASELVSPCHNATECHQRW